MTKSLTIAALALLTFFFFYLPTRSLIGYWVTHYFTNIFVIPWRVLSVNCAESSEIFLKTMLFCVRVPVLSLRIYEILPSSSGMVLFLASAPGMSLSRLIFAENIILEKSRLTLKDIGIIELSKRICLNSWMIQLS